MVIPRIRSRLAQKICMLIYRFQDTGKHQKELDIFMRRLTRIQKIPSFICGKGPVVMLTGTIYPRKRLLMEQTLHAMLAGNTL